MSVSKPLKKYFTKWCLSRGDTVQSQHCNHLKEEDMMKDDDDTIYRADLLDGQLRRVHETVHTEKNSLLKYVIGGRW